MPGQPGTGQNKEEDRRGKGRHVKTVLVTGGYPGQNSRSAIWLALLSAGMTASILILN